MADVYLIISNAIYICIGGAWDVMVMVIGKGHSDPSSNPCQGWESYASNYSPSTYEWIIGQIWLFNFGIATGLREGKLWIQNC